MGYRKEKRPIDARTKGATDFKFDVATSTGTLTVPTISSTASLSGLQYKRNNITTATSASTAFTTRGLVALETTSTTADLNLILSVPTAGEELTFTIKSVATSSFGYTINASTATAVDFGPLTTATPQIRATLSVQGALLSLVALSTARWLVTGQSGVVFSTAAA